MLKVNPGEHSGGVHTSIVEVLSAETPANYKE